MSSSQSPTPDGPHGPAVGDDEELYRCIMYPSWWVADKRRISSVAFKFPRFSVDVASLAGSPDATLTRFLPGTGLVAFPCLAAKQLGCDVRLEQDERHPENQAHAHVYVPAEKRKTIARQLVDATVVIREPHFGASEPHP